MVHSVSLKWYPKTYSYHVTEMLSVRVYGALHPQGSNWILVTSVNDTITFWLNHFVVVMIPQQLWLLSWTLNLSGHAISRGPSLAPSPLMDLLPFVLHIVWWLERHGSWQNRMVWQLNVAHLWPIDDMTPEGSDQALCHNSFCMLHWLSLEGYAMI